MAAVGTVIEIVEFEISRSASYEAKKKVRFLPLYIHGSSSGPPIEPPKSFFLDRVRTSSPLPSFVNGVLDGLMKSGEFEKLYKKWFESPIPPKGINLALPMGAPFKKVVAKPTDSGDPKAYE